jgi:uncharacterized protein (DUF2147 family)
MAKAPSFLRSMRVCLPAVLALGLSAAPAAAGADRSAVVVAAAAATATAETATIASPIGMWTTIDDDTGKARSVVRIYERDGQLFGRIVELFEDPDATCDKCTGRSKGRPILGMIIMWDMKPDGDAWSGGKIFDPEKGKTYRAKIWLENDQTLKLRGYAGPFFRTQTWQRASRPRPPRDANAAGAARCGPPPVRAPGPELASA